ncbi:MAG: PAS domain-containing protein, partial [Verrucomicrobiota bacterium]
MASSSKIDDLRAAAEAALARGVTLGDELPAAALADCQSQIHALDVYRTELELQNEELRRAHFELEEARDRYADLYDFSPVGYFTLSENIRIIEVNLAGAELLKTSRSELVTKPVSAYIIGPDHIVIRHHVSDAIATGSRQVCEIRMLRADGSPIIARLESIAVVATHGSDRVVRTALADITATRLADEALRTLSLAVEQSPASVVIADTKGCITYANRRFTDMTGYQLVELVGKNPRMLKSGQTTDQEYREMWAAISAGNPWSGALLDRRKDGTHYWVRSNISPVTDTTGKITH